MTSVSAHLLAAIRTPDAVRFLAKVRRGPGCWEWSGRRQPNGYGTLHLGTTPIMAHRIAFILANDTIDPDLDVMHACDNRGCVNPSHLSQGTRRMNMAGAVARGRQAKGDRSPASKLSEVQYAQMVAEARGPLVRGDQRRIARKYGVSCALVCMARNGYGRVS